MGGNVTHMAAPERTLAANDRFVPVVVERSRVLFVRAERHSVRWEVRDESGRGWVRGILAPDARARRAWKKLRPRSALIQADAFVHGRRVPIVNPGR